MGRYLTLLRQRSRLTRSAEPGRPGEVASDPPARAPQPNGYNRYDINDINDKSRGSPLTLRTWKSAASSVVAGVPPTAKGETVNGYSRYDINDINDKRAATAEAAPSVEYRHVTSASDLDAVVAALGDAEEVGVDCETTGLSPRTDRVRLLQLAVPTIDGGNYAYVIDLFAVPREALAPLFEALAEKTVVAHHALFDLGMLAPYGFTPGRVVCTHTLSRLAHGTRKPKGFHELKQVVPRELGLPLDKEHQTDDWSVPVLSSEQLRYAARDAAVLLPLHRALAVKVKAEKQEQAADIEARCVPAMAWLSGSGAPFDRGAWEDLAAQARKEAEELADRLDALAPQRDGYLPHPGVWKWNSPDDVQEVFKLLGIDLPDTTDDTLAGIDHPLAKILREYRSAAKLASTYGAGWLKAAYHEGRLYTDWKQIGCVTGRMASAAPNLQNLPGDPRYRACFRAPEGRVLVKADYSQIELRITARVTGDRRMLEAYANGEDLHTLTARQMTGRQEVTAQERKLAKPVNFGLIYGLSSARLRKKAKAEYGLDLSPQDADRYREAFFRTYPGVRAWHGRLRAESAPAVRTLAGRRCQLPERHFYGTRANYTVQGTGGDGIKLALALLWERRHQCPGAIPVMVIHDEIIVEADAGQAEAAEAWLKAALVDAMTPLIAPVSVEVEALVGRTWAGDLPGGGAPPGPGLGPDDAVPAGRQEPEPDLTIEVAAAAPAPAGPVPEPAPAAPPAVPILPVPRRRQRAARALRPAAGGRGRAGWKPVPRGPTTASATP
jgi:DNA polymerase-1